MRNLYNGESLKRGIFKTGKSLSEILPVTRDRGKSKILKQQTAFSMGLSAQ